MFRMRPAGVLVFLLAMCPVHGQQQGQFDARISVQRVSGGTILVRDVAGSYARHPEVFAELMRHRDQFYRGVGDCFGVYPMDPDAIAADEMLRWRVGVRVAPLNAGDVVRRAPRGYRIERMPDTDAAVIETDVQRAAMDGLSVIRWMAENGYVQVGPTRLEYRTHEGNPQLIPARIIVPVKARASGLKLAARGA